MVIPKIGFTIKTDEINCTPLPSQLYLLPSKDKDKKAYNRRIIDLSEAIWIGPQMNPPGYFFVYLIIYGKRFTHKQFQFHPGRCDLARRHSNGEQA